MADIIQSQDLKDLCSVLVVLSSEAAKTFQGNMILSSNLIYFFFTQFVDLRFGLLRSLAEA